MSIPLTETRERFPILKHDYFIAALIAVAASGLTFALGFALGWFPNGVNGFEVVAATLNYGATYLSIKQRRFTYALGFVASAFWAVAFFQYGLIASSILSLYLVGQLVYGYFRWGPDAESRPVHKFQWKYLWAYALATAVTYGGAVAISTAFGGSFAFWDGAILVATIWAQFMLDNKVLGAWYVWTLVNVIGVGLYFSAGAPFAVVQQFLFGLSNIWGYLSWRKSMQNSSEKFSEDPETENYKNQNSRLTVTDELVYDDTPAGDNKAEAAYHGTDRTPEAPLKRLTGSDYPLTIREKTGETFKFNGESHILYITTGQKPIVKDGGDDPLWRRIKETDKMRDLFSLRWVRIVAVALALTPIVILTWPYMWGAWLVLIGAPIAFFTFVTLVCGIVEVTHWVVYGKWRGLYEIAPWNY